MVKGTETSSKDKKNARNLVCLPAEEIANVIALAHSSLEAGHDKEGKTAQRILQVYWFPGLFNEVQKFIQDCLVCLQNKEKDKKVLLNYNL